MFEKKDEEKFFHEFVGKKSSFRWRKLGFQGFLMFSNFEEVPFHYLPILNFWEIDKHVLLLKIVFGCFRIKNVSQNLLFPISIRWSIRQFYCHFGGANLAGTWRSPPPNWELRGTSPFLKKFQIQMTLKICYVWYDNIECFKQSFRNQVYSAHIKSWSYDA